MKLFKVTLVLVLINAASVFAGAKDWKANYSADKCSFASQGENPYVILKPGFVMEYESGDSRLVVTVLNETRKVDGVETRVVEERETKNGKLEEVSRNYFAICKETGDLCYFGENVDMYKEGKIADHGGSWLSGAKGAKYGVMIPGKPKKGQKYYQENAPGEAQDRAENLSIKTTIKTKAGKFKNCLKTLETSPLEPNSKEAKIYALGVGLVKDGDLLLVKYGFKK
jgi:hypothetical protein